MNLALTNPYIFMYGVMLIYMLEFIALLLCLWMGAALIAWPIRYFMKAMLRLFHRAGRGLQN
jgi:hypothetical protein